MMPYIILAIVIVLILYVISMYNKFIRLRNKVDEAFSTMDVYLKKRFDLIPNLVETVKGYAKHESETLEKIIQARNMSQSANSVDERMKSEGQVSSLLGSFFAIAESYPDLKADRNFLDLQDQLKNIESEIVSARKYYNGVTREYNTCLQVFPNNIFAGMFNFKERPLFEVSDPTERENVKVQF